MKRLLLLAMFAVVSFGSIAAFAQEYPARPVRMLVPFPPGGGTDVIGRIVAQKLADRWNQQILVENRPGAAGLVGADVVAKAAPDGYMLLMTALGGLSLENLGQFSPVVLVAAPPSVVVVHPEVRATSVAELISLSRAQPGKLNFGSSGAGSLSHLAAELLKSMAKVDIVHVPYKGMGQVVGELLGNQIQFAVAPLPAVQGHIRAGKLRALAVTSQSRFAPLPDVPSVSESGLVGYEAINWFGLLVGSGVPKPIVDRLNAEVNRILQLQDVKEKLKEIGADPAGGTAEEFSRYIRADTEKWARILASVK